MDSSWAGGKPSCPKSRFAAQGCFTSSPYATHTMGCSSLKKKAPQMTDGLLLGRRQAVLSQEPVRSARLLHFESIRNPYYGLLKSQKKSPTNDRWTPLGQAASRPVPRAGSQRKAASLRVHTQPILWVAQVSKKKPSK